MVVLPEYPNQHAVFSKLVELFPAFAFDIEGTLINLEPIHFDCHAKALAAVVGSDALTGEAIMALPGAVGGGDLKIAQLLSELYPGIRADEHYQSKMDLFHSAIKSTRITTRNGVGEFLMQLNYHNAKIGYGTLTRQADAERYINETYLKQCMSSQAAVYFEDVVNKKPAPDVYLRLAEKLGVPADSLVIFEDSVTGVQAAAAAGAKLIIATPVFPQFNDDLIKAGASAVLDWKGMNFSREILSLALQLN